MHDEEKLLPGRELPDGAEVLPCRKRPEMPVPHAELPDESEGRGLRPEGAVDCRAVAWIAFKLAQAIAERNRTVQNFAPIDR